MQYISEGSYHTLQEWAMERMSNGEHNKEKSMESHPAEARVAACIPGDTPTIDGRRQADRTGDMDNDVDRIEDNGASSTPDKVEGQRAEYDANEPTENRHVAIGIQCESLSREQPPGPSPMNSHAGMDTSGSETERTMPC
jgi:hypothetical protein